MNTTNYNTTKDITDIWVTNQFLNLRTAPHKRSISDTVNLVKNPGDVIGPGGSLPGRS